MERIWNIGWELEVHRNLGHNYAPISWKIIAVILIFSYCTTLLIVNVQCANWESVASPTTENLGSVFMVDSNDGWATDGYGKIFRWNGTSWNSMELPFNARLESVFMVSANDGWGVGGGGLILRWNGATWNTIGIPSHASLYSVFMVSTNDGWAVGYDGTIIRWNGASWNNVTSPTTADLYSVFMVNANDGWAVGNSGTILRWNGATWNIIMPKPTTNSLSSVFMVSANEGYAVGNFGILRWNGASWNAVTTPTSTGFLNSVFIVDSNDGWAVGSFGHLFRLDESGWYEMICPTTESLGSVFMVDSNDGWAVGGGGTILRLTDGKTLHASFASAPGAPEAGETISFDAAGSFDSDGTVVDYAWDFGDNSFGSGITSTHAYEQNGTYTVKLTVTDNNGLEDIFTKNIVVGSPPQDITVPNGMVEINSGASETNSVSVTLTLEASDMESGVTEMHFSNDGSTWTDWEAYRTTEAWTLTTGDGTKQVFVQFKNNADLVSEIYSDAITLNTEKDGSSISIAVSKTTLTIGESISVSGTLSPPKEGEEIEIQYRVDEEIWTTLSTVITDSSGGYSYNWTPTRNGTYEIKVNWAGSETTLSSFNIFNSITVSQEGASDSFLYFIVGVIIGIAAIIGVYYLWYLPNKKKEEVVKELEESREKRF